ncbi:BQ5605_C002g01277 [Microbotryum silenes-dioicae]|uniref:BQ5605_C002g01277 protein n=1 Tax=Microbotryum silenes-dioicae TaxID=796604 RepID=A0A2X0MT35_9BASI|nr:BQ5605_C002g01277 [Microbotryum silenes-dioicae]
MAVCAYCMARHWECKGRTGHRSTCCSQGKVRLPPPLRHNPECRQLREGSDSDAKAFRENARSYNNALSFTSLAAHWDQTQVGTLGPPVFRVFGRLYHRLGALIPAVNQRPAFAQTWLIDPAEATDTRLQGPDSAETRIQRSTLTKLESMLRTGNRFVREFASAKARAGWDTAKEWVLRLCLPPGRDRRTHNLPTSSTEMAMIICDSDINTGDRGPQDLILQVHGDRCPGVRPKYQIVSSLHPSAMPLRYPLLFPAGEDGFHPNIPLCEFHQAGPPIARNREQIDNGVQLRELLAGLGLDDEDEEEDEDRDDEDEDGEEGDEENGDDERKRLPLFLICSFLLRRNEEHLAYYLHEHGDYFSIPHATQRLFLEFVIDGYSQLETDRLNYIRFHQENLRLTTAQGITDAVANGLTPDQIGRSVILGSTFKNSPREVTQRYQDAMACVVKYGKPSLFITVTCNPEWPKSRLHWGRTTKHTTVRISLHECSKPSPATSNGQAVSVMNGFCFFAVLRIVFS